jgi:putative Holliday junction resolvase
VVERAASGDGLAEVARLIGEEEADRVIVGMPLTLRGERGQQAEETERFVEALRGVTDVPVETFDERFTTALAGQGGGGRSAEDARAAAHLLAGYLAQAEARQA